MKIIHFNDKKEKRQSHEITLDNDYIPINKELSIYSIDPLDIIGYGESKEEAFEKFKEKFHWLCKTLNEFDKELETKYIDKLLKGEE